MTRLKKAKYCSEIPPNNEHPSGGYKIAITDHKNNKHYKKEKVLWCDSYQSKKELEDDIQRWVVKIKEDLKAVINKADFEANLPSRITTLADAIDLKLAREGDSGIPEYFKIIRRKYGEYKPSEWRDMYYTVINELKSSDSNYGKPRSPATINRYMSAFSLLFKFAQKEGIPDLQIEYDFDVEEGRDRVLSPEEKERLFKAMEGSWLEHAIYFAYYNPIRAGDQFGYQSEDPKKKNGGIRVMNWFQKDNYITVKAHKTYARKKNRKQQLTYFMQIDEKIREYFKSLPQNPEQHLFPRKMEDGTYRQLKCYDGYREYRDEFQRLLKKAEIEDFHWHDLKHCAITNIVKKLPVDVNIFVYLKKLGVQYSEKMVLKYTNYDINSAPRLPGFE